MAGKPCPNTPSPPKSLDPKAIGPVASWAPRASRGALPAISVASPRDWCPSGQANLQRGGSPVLHCGNRFLPQWRTWERSPKNATIEHRWRLPIELLVGYIQERSLWGESFAITYTVLFGAIHRGQYMLRTRYQALRSFIPVYFIMLYL